MILILLYYVVSLLVQLDTVQATSFTSGPGVVRTYPRALATLTWTLDGPLDLSRSRVTLTYITTVFYQRFQNGQVYWSGGYQPRTSVTYTDSNQKINVQLSYVNTSDTTGRFSCRTEETGVFDETNNNARIFLYSLPSGPTISMSPNEVVEHSRLTLTCRAATTSVPADLAPDMEYSWTRNNQPLPPRHSTAGDQNSQLIIDPVLREDHQQTYTCVARESGSRESRGKETSFDVQFKPIFQSAPATIYQSAENSSFSYIIRMMANPLPTFEMINWNFQSSRTLPENVVTSVLDTADPDTKDIVLYILSVKDIHYGTYQLAVQNSHGQERVQFDLKQIGPPLPGSAPVLVKSTAVSLHITWTAGYNGGLDQTLDVMYQLEGSTVVHMSRVDSPVNVSTGDVVYHKVTEALQPESTYKVWARSTNSFSGQTSQHGPASAFSTTAKAVFVSEPVIELDNNKANIKLHIRGPLTHILVENCVTGIAVCTSQRVQVPSLDTVITPQGESQTETDHIFDVFVDLVDQNTELFVFHLWLFDEDDRLSNEPFRVLASVAVPESRTTLIIAVVVPVVVLVLLAVCVTVIMLRKRQAQNKNSSDDINQDHRTYENMNPEQTVSVSGVSSDRTTGYETFGLTEKKNHEISQCRGTYEELNIAELPSFTSKELTFEDLLSESSNFKIWKASPVTDNIPFKCVVIKQLEGDKQEQMMRFISSQATCAWRLRHTSLFVPCFGLSSDMILLEYTPLGELYQHLTSLSDDAYRSMTGVLKTSHLMPFIRQVAEAVNFLYNHKTPMLFYCLSAKHVLLYNNDKIKVTGFAESSAVQNREKWEHKIGTPRPVRWLAPEATNLRHEKKSDVWSLAVLIWEIINLGKQPFEQFHDEDVGNKIMNGDHPEKTGACGQDLYNVLTKCWQLSPSNRPTPDTVLTEINELLQYEAV